MLVLPTGFACALKRMPTTIIGKALHSLNLLVARQLVHDIARYRDHVALHVVPPLCPLDFSPYDYGGGAALIDRATTSTRAWINAGGLAAQAEPGPLVEHHH